MRTLHTIRLRGPWGCQPLARFEWDEAGLRSETTADLPPSGRVKMPADWSSICGADFRGRVRFRRRFHWPTPLTPRERVWLVFESVAGSAQVRLNDEVLGEFSADQTPAEFDVTARLDATNVLIVDVSCPLERPAVASSSSAAPLTGGLTAEVRLEVRLRRAGSLGS
jgi:hypothetical protein